MAIRSIAQLKAWYKRGTYPTAEQFADWLDSFFHKEDKVSIDNIDGLTDRLNAKYDLTSGKDLESRQGKLEEDLLKARLGALQMSIQSREWESIFRGKNPYVGKVVFVKIDGAQEDLDALAADGCRIVLLRRKKVKRNKQALSVDPFNHRRSKTKWSLSANPLPKEGIVPQFPLLNEFALPTKVGEWSPLYTVADNTLAVVSDVVKGFCRTDKISNGINLRNSYGIGLASLGYTEGGSIRAKYAFAIRRQIAEKDVWNPETGNMTPRFIDSHIVPVWLYVTASILGSTFDDLRYAIVQV